MDFLLPLLETSAVVADVIGIIAGAIGVWLGIQALKDILSTSSADEKISEDDANRLIELREKIKREKNEDVAEHIRLEARRYEERIRAFKRTSLWSDDGSIRITWIKTLVVTRERLIEESGRLGARSRANLRAGIFVSMIGLATLVLTLLFFKPEVESKNITEVIIEYGPRFLLVIIIQFVSAFFFRLYASNEKDIKINKNEITNIEQKISAGLMLQENEPSMLIAAENLLNDDRNNISNETRESEENGDRLVKFIDYIRSFKP